MSVDSLENLHEKFERIEEASSKTVSSIFSECGHLVGQETSSLWGAPEMLTAFIEAHWLYPETTAKKRKSEDFCAIFWDEFPQV
jgi:hypothetical protein